MVSQDLRRAELLECGYSRAQVDKWIAAVDSGRVTEVTVSSTPNGRDIRLVKGGFIVQPRDDNYWITVPSIDDAMDAFEHPEKHRAEW
jgi:hypothetical protein